MKIVNEFKQFIARGNVLDMAVGIIIGSAFTKIVNSLVADIITPFISILTGKVNFATLAYQVNEETALKYGNFIQTIIDFLIIAIVVFLMVKFVNRTKSMFEKKEEEAPPAPLEPSNEEVLLTEIRDLLKEQK